MAPLFDIQEPVRSWTYLAVGTGWVQEDLSKCVRKCLCRSRQKPGFAIGASLPGERGPLRGLGQMPAGFSERLHAPGMVKAYRSLESGLPLK